MPSCPLSRWFYVHQRRLQHRHHKRCSLTQGWAVQLTRCGSLMRAIGVFAMVLAQNTASSDAPVVSSCTYDSKYPSSSPAIAVSRQMIAKCPRFLLRTTSFSCGQRTLCSEGPLLLANCLWTCTPSYTLAEHGSA